jgi:UDP-3-O-[3-hydroxymyristoyl] glucosamine N-acyltransferase
MKLTLSEISDYVSGQVVGDKKLLIEGVSEIQDSRLNTITFLSNPLYKKYLEKTKSSAILVKSAELLGDKSGIVVENPQLAMAKTLELFFPKKITKKTIHPSANISPNSRIGNDVSIGPSVFIMSNSVIKDGSYIGANSFIGENVVVGFDSVIHPNVSVYNGTFIGDNVIIHSGTVIGCDGFGYVIDKKSNYKIPQTGQVEIKNNVEIGSNCSIDRGTIGKTVIGEGSKLDNLIQIAHNVKIGKNCLIASQVGISGSTFIGDSCTFAGQVGVAGHLKIGPDSTFAAKSGVTKSHKGGKTYAGFPARKIREHNKSQAILNKIGKDYYKINK